MSPNQIQRGAISEIADAMRRDHTPSPLNNRLGTTVLLTGAGCSKSGGVPLAGEIAQELCLKLSASYQLILPDGRDHEDALRKLVESNRLSSGCLKDGCAIWAQVYEELFTQHYRTPKEARNVFTEIFESRDVKLNWAHLCIGELVRLGYVSTVLTTNFDQLALEGIARAGRLPIVADGVESLNRITGHPTHPQLIQIHGSRHTYRLRNSTVELDELAREGGAIHAIDELMRAATVFIVAGYGGKERGLMQLLIEGAKRFPDTHIFWIAHEKDESELGNLAVDLLRTSRYSRVLYSQDADVFFNALLVEMGIGAPKVIDDPLFGVGNLKQSLASSSNEAIGLILEKHFQKVERIQAVFDPISVGQERSGENVSGIEEGRTEAVEALAASIANDFNNALTTTLGYTEILLKNQFLDSSVHSDLLEIWGSADKAASLVNRLLAFASSLKLNPQRVDVNKAVVDLSFSLIKFKRHEIEINYDLTPSIWTVSVDLTQFENVIVSLVTNAVDAIDGPGTITISTSNQYPDETSEVKAVREGQTVLLVVADTGRGVNPALLDRIFDPYVTTKALPNAGMGLSAARGIIKQSGGSITYESKLGKGSQFRVHLPRLAALPATREFTKASTSEPPTHALPVDRRLVALYVEDEKGVRDFTVRVLKDMGFVVFQASSGIEAIALSKTLTDELTLVMSDMVMANGDGASVLRALRSDGYRGPFIMASGYAEEDVRSSLVSDDALLFLPKPYSIVQLQDAIAAMMRRSREVA